MAVPFDRRRLDVTGAAVGVVSDVMQAVDIRPLQLEWFAPRGLVRGRWQWRAAGDRSGWTVGGTAVDPEARRRGRSRVMGPLMDANWPTPPPASSRMAAPGPAPSGWSGATGSRSLGSCCPTLGYRTSRSIGGGWPTPTTNISPRQVYATPYPALDQRVQVSTDGGSEPAWRRDGRELYYLQNVSAGDGQRFIMVQEVQRPQARVSQTVLVQNWVEELKQRATLAPEP